MNYIPFLLTIMLLYLGQYCLKVHTHGSNGGAIKTSPDPILPSLPRQNNCTATAAVCVDLNKYYVNEKKYRHYLYSKYNRYLIPTLYYYTRYYSNTNYNYCMNFKCL